MLELEIDALGNTYNKETGNPVPAISVGTPARVDCTYTDDDSLDKAVEDALNGVRLTVYHQDPEFLKELVRHTKAVERGEDSEFDYKGPLFEPDAFTLNGYFDADSIKVIVGSKEEGKFKGAIQFYKLT